MQEARIELLKRMPIFGGIRSEVLQFLLALCSIVSTPANELFFREHDQGDSLREKRTLISQGTTSVLTHNSHQSYAMQHVIPPRAASRETRRQERRRNLA